MIISQFLNLLMHTHCNFFFTLAPALQPPVPYYQLNYYPQQVFQLQSLIEFIHWFWLYGLANHPFLIQRRNNNRYHHDHHLQTLTLSTGNPPRGMRTEKYPIDRDWDDPRNSLEDETYYPLLSEARNPHHLIGWSYFTTPNEPTPIL